MKNFSSNDSKSVCTNIEIIYIKKCHLDKLFPKFYNSGHSYCAYQFLLKNVFHFSEILDGLVFLIF